MMISLTVAEIREIAENGMHHSHGRQSGDQGRKRIKYPGKAEFFLGQEAWLYENQTDRADSYTSISDYTVSNGLTLDDAQNE